MKLMKRSTRENIFRIKVIILFVLLQPLLLLTACIAKSGIERAKPTPTSSSYTVATPRLEHPLPLATPFLIPSPITLPSLTPTPVVPTLKGNLWNQITRLEDSMPIAGSEGFVIPGDDEKAAFSEIVIALKHRDIVRAAEIAAANNYKLFQYTDRKDKDAQSYMLRESDPIIKGWGLYFFRIGTSSNVVIEAPHPLSDENTPQIAMQLYRALDARALLIAGAHRDANRDGSSDITHASQTVFQAIHETLVSSDTPVVLQIHGFSAGKHPGYPQVVLGHNLDVLMNSQTPPAEPQTSAEQELLNRLADSLIAEEVSVGICDGNSWQDLCGEKNVQAKTMHGSVFIHIELDEAMRGRKSKMLISAITRVLAK